MNVRNKINLNRLYRILKLFGFDPVALFSSILGLKFYLNDFNKIIKQRGQDKTFNFGRNFPIFSERSSEAGTMSGHYFHQDLLVASKIFINNPIRHIDIGSRIDGFVAHVAVFREIEIFDIRNLNSNVQNIVFKQADLMSLPDDLVEYCDSISSLHAIEHFGLGRYGDPIDYYGHIKVIENIYKILKRKGKFYFSVPIGPQRIEFNAHRVFSLQYLINLLDSKFYIETFNYVDDKGDLFINVELSPAQLSNNFNCHYGCGIFELTKR
jgi:SAM-dependent methyltransferase